MGRARAVVLALLVWHAGCDDGGGGRGDADAGSPADGGGRVDAGPVGDGGPGERPGDATAPPGMPVDTDGDGLSDAEEAARGTDPRSADTDGDGLADGDEARAGSDPLRGDTDDDGIGDAEEVQRGLDPTLADTDADGLSDPLEEPRYGTDPANADSDGDGLLDGDEIRRHGTSPLSVDTDGDGLGDVFEVLRGTSSRRTDTDGDGLLDGEEIFTHHSDPLDADSDRDGLDDAAEVELGTDLWDPDTDADGLDDDDEVVRGTTPLAGDSDGDGVRDGDEVRLGADPLVRDTDGDGLEDGDEVRFRSGPTRPDSDADGLPDGADVEAGGDPVAPDSDADSLPDGLEVRSLGTRPDRADTDGDGLSDGVEVRFGLDPLNADDAAMDHDGDGLVAHAEIAAGTALRVPDTDQDGLPDGWEASIGGDPLAADADGDGLLDGTEVRAAIDPLLDDSDGDGIPDGAEPEPLVDLDGDGLPGAIDPDGDGDGLDDAMEPAPDEDDDGDGLIGVLDPDSDGDGIPDGAEVQAGLDPRDPDDADLDRDGDGATNRDEVRAGTDVDSVDTDEDGLPDGAELRLGMRPLDPRDAARDYDLDRLTNLDEVRRGLNPFAHDSDEDGLPDGRELELGSDPTRADTDGDGVADGDEVAPTEDVDGDGLIGLLDDDQDGDGLRDGDEPPGGDAVRRADRDGDGLDDAAELAAGLDPDSRDTDGDGLSDDQERAGCRLRGGRDARVVVTSARRPDTDEDGLSDGLECLVGLDPTEADTDGDGLTDGEELVEGRAARTDPRRADTDRDGVPDGPDPDPRQPDADADGVPDARELVDGWNGVVRTFEPPAGNRAFAPPVQRLPLPPGLGTRFGVAVQAGPARRSSPDRPEPDGLLVVHVDGIARLRAAVSADGDAWFLTGPLTGAEAVEVHFARFDRVRVRRVAVFPLPEVPASPEAAAMPTLADVADTDEDGLDDGTERRNGAIWFEAEHFAAGLTVEPVPRAGSGAAVRVAPGRRVVFTGDLGAVLEEVPWSVFIRARRGPTGIIRNLLPEVLVVVDTDPRPCAEDADCPVGSCLEDGVCDAGTSFRPAFGDSWGWAYAGTFVPHGGRFRIGVLDVSPDDRRPWSLDRIVLVPMRFAPERLLVRVEDLPAEQRHPWLAGRNFYPTAADLPWGLVDPLSPDTDGDGIRVVEGAVPGSRGRLTDGREVRLRLNPFDADSDWDASVSTEWEWFLDAGTSWRAEGDGFVFEGPPDGRPDLTDDMDPSPRSLDFDRDGIPDEAEVAAELAARLAACRAAAGCGPDGACEACPAHRFDGEEDLDCAVDDTLPGEVRPLCFHADDDRDDDGVLDGREDRNRNGVFDPGVETNADDTDSDGDGLPDGLELGLVCPEGEHSRVAAGVVLPALCDGQWREAESGFRPDPDEGRRRTDPTRADTDGDGLDDGEEDENLDGVFSPDLGETDPAAADTDRDGLRDGDELRLGADPLRPDTDGDALSDGDEVDLYATDPRRSDTDGDTLTDGDEVHRRRSRWRTDPARADTDGDGLDDGVEVLGAGPLQRFGPTDPTREDSDGDGLGDGQEIRRWPSTHPGDADTDGDGLGDGVEVEGRGVLERFGPTDPTRADSDADGFLDGAEVASGTDPRNRVDVPHDLVLGAGGLSIRPPEGASWSVQGDVVQTQGSIELGCAGGERGFVLDGRLVLRRTGGTYEGAADGVLSVRQADGSRQVLWRGPTRLDVGRRVASPAPESDAVDALWLDGGAVLMDLRPVPCATDRDCPASSCVEGRCESDAPFGISVCDGTFGGGPVRMAFATQGGQMAFTAGRVRWGSQADRVQIDHLVLPQSFDPAGIPPAERPCWLDPEPYDVPLLLAGALDLALDPDLPDPPNGPALPDGPDLPQLPRPPRLPDLRLIGRPAVVVPGLSLPRPAVPDPDLPLPDVPGLDLPFISPGMVELRFHLLDLALPDGLALPDVPDAPEIPIDLPDVPRPPRLPPLPGAPRFPAVVIPEADLDLSLGGLPDVPLAELLLAAGMPCRWDLAMGRFHCEGSFSMRGKRRSGGGPRPKYNVYGRVDVDLRGLVSYQTSRRHAEAIERLECAEGLEICQNGHFQIEGQVEIPLPGLPGFKGIITGITTADVGRMDDDPPFVGFYGSLSLGNRYLSAAAGFVPLDLPLAVKVGDASMVLVFDENDEPTHLLAASRQGVALDDYVDLSALPEAARDMFVPQPDVSAYCLDLQTGRLEGAGRIRPLGFDIDWRFVLDPPFENGQFDLEAGGFRGEGTLALDRSLFIRRARLLGEIGWDGRFLFEGQVEGGVEIPGLGGLTLADVVLRLSDRGALLDGRLDVPELGTLTAHGEIWSDGRFDLGLRGRLAPGGFELVDVRGRLTSELGAEVSGQLGLPWPDAPSVDVSGHIAGPADWELRGRADVGLPFGGFELADAEVTLSPRGLVIEGDLHIPGFSRIRVRGRVESDGDIRLEGDLDHGVGPLRLDGELTFEWDVDGGIPGVEADSTLRIDDFRISRQRFAISDDGEFEVRSRVRYVALDFDVRLQANPRRGSFSLSGEVDVGGCVDVGVCDACAEGEVRLRLSDDEVEARFSGEAGCGELDIGVGGGVDSDGCVDGEVDLEFETIDFEVCF